MHKSQEGREHCLNIDLLNQLNQINEQEIERFNVIGEGSQGKVYKGRYKENDVIIKESKKHIVDIKEIKAYSKLFHINMVQFYGYYLDSDKRVNIVLEYAEGDDLADLIPDEKLTIEHKYEIVLQLCSLLVYLRKEHTVHRDLKPENIKVKLLDSSKVSVKVLDFGIAKMSDQSMMSGTTIGTGTILYSPPEIFNPTGESKTKINFKFDIWSLGLIISYMFSDEVPWNKKKGLQIEHALFTKIKFPVPENLSQDIRRVVSLCTDVNSEGRINALTVLYLMEEIKNGRTILDLKLKDENFK